MIIHILIALFTLFIVWVTYNYYQALKLKANMKGPTIYPLILNDYLFWFSGLSQVLEDLFNKYGETTYIISNSTCLICTMNPDNIQHFISQQHNFHNYKRERKHFDGKVTTLSLLGKKLFGDGIFISDNERWAIQRAHAKPLFKKESIIQMTPTFVQNGKVVLDLIKQGDPNTAIDVQNLFMRYTLDSFGEIGFGVSLDVLANEKPFPSWFDRAQILLVQFTYKIFHRLLYRKEYFEVINNLDGVIYDIIAQKKKRNRSPK